MMVFNLGVTTALADGMVFPQMMVSEYLGVRYHHVTVTIVDNHAVTRVEQEFYNPQDFPVMGRYVFPVPPEAILSGFQAQVDGEEQVVTWQSPSTTNAYLYDLVADRQDPSLLQYADWESLAFDISLPAGGSRKMTLQYEELLAPSGGLIHYKYIMSTERYSSQLLEEVSMTIDLRSSSGLSTVYSSSHNVTTERYGEGQARVTWSAQDVRPGEDFDLFFAPADGGFGGGLLTGKREGMDHFLFLFAPELDALREVTLPKDIVFVIDRSGSMDGEKMTQARDALAYILGQLNPNDRFSVVDFDDRISVFSPTLRLVDSQSLNEANNYVYSLFAREATDIESALRRGLGIFEGSETRSEATKMVVFLTDGLPTAGVVDGETIAKLVSDVNQRVGARIHAFGVGYDVNSHLLDRLAGDNGGMVTYVQPGEDLEGVLAGFYGRIANPVLTDVTVEFEGTQVSEIYPQNLPDMFQGSSLTLTGLYQAADPEVTVKVSGRAGKMAKEYIYHFNLSETGGYDFVPQLWATRRIGSLLDVVRVEGETPGLVDEIRSLGLGYGLVTPYTTFIITPQMEGAASTENMNLYADQFNLNQVSGQTTIQARVQNQMYQQANQAGMAVGANVVNIGQSSMAQVTDQNVDLSLLQGKETTSAITLAWLDETIGIDLFVTFGTEEYFKLASDPRARAFLQSGPNVVFEHNGLVIAVQAEGVKVPYGPAFDSPDFISMLVKEFFSLLRRLFSR
jgi:Ca-activated chloride channel family protein